MAGKDVMVDVAARAIMVAAFVNTLVKAALASVIGGADMARRVGTTLVLSILCGAIAIFILE
jgi:uncharacterized membrane protein (DUF4010 family)